MGDTVDQLSLQASVIVDAGPDVAFAAFTCRITDWGVREFSWSGRDHLVGMGIEPRLDGKAYEIGPHGFRMDWGRVLCWEPPQRLVLSWQIAPDRVPQPDPARCSEIHVRFRAHRDSTIVELEHRHFERHGPAASGYRQAMTDGWRDLLGRYAETCRVAAANRPDGTTGSRPTSSVDR